MLIVTQSHPHIHQLTTMADQLHPLDNPFHKHCVSPTLARQMCQPPPHLIYLTTVTNRHLVLDVGCETASEWLWWRFALHSVQIYVGYVDNMMTFCCLRHSSGQPVDCTIYTMVTDQLKCIELVSNMCPLIWWWIFLSDSTVSQMLHQYSFCTWSGLLDELFNNILMILLS